MVSDQFLAISCYGSILCILYILFQLFIIQVHVKQWALKLISVYLSMYSIILVNFLIKRYCSDCIQHISISSWCHCIVQLAIHGKERHHHNQINIASVLIARNILFVNNIIATDNDQKYTTWMSVKRQRTHPPLDMSIGSHLVIVSTTWYDYT